MVLEVLDLVGAFVFGISGAIAGIRHKIDLFGVIVLSFITASAGGIIRGLIIGSIPPVPMSQWQYIVVALLPGPFTFYFYSTVKRLNQPLWIFDAAGLSLFAVSGSLKALEFNLNPIAAVLLGVLTGVGGGVTRDILVREEPVILRRDIYAVAALAGSSAVVIGYMMGLPVVELELIGVGLCFFIRIGALHYRWRLPILNVPE